SNQAGKADIYLEVANYTHSRGGFWESPIIGEVNRVNNLIERKDIVELFFISGLLVMGLFFLLLYGFARENKKLLYMGLLCILIALRSLTIGQSFINSIFPFLDWDFSMRLKYLTAFLGLPIMGKLSYSFHYTKKLKGIQLFYLIFTVLACTVAVFSSYDLIYQLAKYYRYLLIPFFIYLIYQAGVGVFKEGKEATLVIIGYSAVILGVFLEVLIPNNSFFMMYGIFIMMSLIAFMIVSDYAATKRINTYLDTVKKQKKELENLYSNLTNELDKARNLHENTLPGYNPLNNISLASYYQPAGKLGGDFFDITEIDGKTVFYISDISGHDISSSIISLFVKDTIHNFLSFSSETDPKSILEFLTEQFYKEDFPGDYFICIFIAIIDFEAKKISYLGNGFQFSQLICAPNSEKFKLENSGLPISSSIDKNLLDFKTRSVDLKSGSSLLFYTDGIAEQKVADESYGTRLEDVFYRNCDLNPEGIKESILTDFKNFNNNSLQGDDDITFVVIKVD
ncbi:MAG: SpoIIE family protein phosphatase, partial [Halanaerobacter sp.]